MAAHFHPRHLRARHLRARHFLRAAPASGTPTERFEGRRAGGLGGRRSGELLGVSAGGLSGRGA